VLLVLVLGSPQRAYVYVIGLDCWWLEAWVVWEGGWRVRMTAALGCCCYGGRLQGSGDSRGAGACGREKGRRQGLGGRENRRINPLFSCSF
jgi:hypothetical protein